MTCWTLVLLALHSVATAGEAALRSVGAAPATLTASVHATAPALWALVAFMVVAFYAMVRARSRALAPGSRVVPRRLRFASCCAT